MKWILDFSHFCGICGRLILFSLFLDASTAFAQVMYINPDSSVQIYVDKTYGATIALPNNIHFSTKPLLFKIHVVHDDDSSDKNISIIEISPPEKHFLLTKTKDKMNVLLWNGKSISFDLILDENINDNLYNIKFNHLDENHKNKNDGFKNADQNSLLDQKNLLIHMIKDESVNERRVVHMNVDFSGYKDVHFKLVRLFHNNGWAGYVFLVTNTGNKTIHLNATALSMGKPNRISLIQVDHETLQTCRDNPEADPRGTGCTTALRIVSRDADTHMPFDFSSDTRSDSQTTPFVVVKIPDKEKQKNNTTNNNQNTYTKG